MALWKCMNRNKFLEIYNNFNFTLGNTPANRLISGKYVGDTTMFRWCPTCGGPLTQNLTQITKYECFNCETIFILGSNLTKQQMYISYGIQTGSTRIMTYDAATAEFSTDYMAFDYEEGYPGISDRSTAVTFSFCYNGNSTVTRSFPDGANGWTVKSLTSGGTYNGKHLVTVTATHGVGAFPAHRQVLKTTLRFNASDAAQPFNVTLHLKSGDVRSDPGDKTTDGSPQLKHFMTCLQYRTYVEQGQNHAIICGKRETGDTINDANDGVWHLWTPSASTGNFGTCFGWIKQNINGDIPLALNEQLSHDAGLGTLKFMIIDLPSSYNVNGGYGDVPTGTQYIFWAERIGMDPHSYLEEAYNVNYPYFMGGRYFLCKWSLEFLNSLQSWQNQGRVGLYFWTGDDTSHQMTLINNAFFVIYKSSINYAPAGSGDYWWYG